MKEQINTSEDKGTLALDCSSVCLICLTTSNSKQANSTN